MKKRFLQLLISAFCLPGLFSCSEKGHAEQPGGDDPEPEITPDEYYCDTTAVMPFSWSAATGYDGVIDSENGTLYPEKKARDGKFVGVFYFTWHGCHGYDVHEDHNEVQVPGPGDVKSPYDIQKLLDENPKDPQYGPVGACHHWGEPYLGYYVAGDEWIIRKHAQMLSDAGVDVVLLDVTNGYTYLPVVKTMCETFLAMRAEGNDTPQFAFVLNSNVPGVTQSLWDEIYSKDLYKELWFYWLGKPLMLANPVEAVDIVKENFTLRQSWFLNAPEHKKANEWFGDGVDKWPWGNMFPQQAGKHAGKNECVAVMPATHPTSNVGRSYSISTGQPSLINPAKGYFFKTEFEYALRLDPQFLFITGWNEWIAMRFTASEGQNIALMGKKLNPGETYFVDQYNHEFSRDLEPLQGDYGDNYYYIMVDYIRRFKGVKKIPSFSETTSITVDGNFSDWNGVGSSFADNRGDITDHDHFGWGRVGQLTNFTGRNDIVLSRVANDGKNVFFYVKTASPITSQSDPAWMQLFIGNGATTAGSGWEGFGYCVNRISPTGSKAVLEKSEGGWKWAKVADVDFAVNGCEMEVSIPMSDLGITAASKFTLEFKWVDNAAADGDIQTCMRDGDSAPNGRFRYRYKFEK